MEESMLLIKLAPKNEVEELQALREQYEFSNVKVEGTIRIPKRNTIITDEGHLIIVFPSRLDLNFCFEPSEFCIVAENLVKINE